MVNLQTMNSRERVLSTINHQEPDRVPIDIGATLSTGIHAIAYTRLKEYLGMKGGQHINKLTKI